MGAPGHEAFASYSEEWLHVDDSTRLTKASAIFSGHFRSNPLLGWHTMAHDYLAKYVVSNVSIQSAR